MNLQDLSCLKSHRKNSIYSYLTKKRDPHSFYIGQFYSVLYSVLLLAFTVHSMTGNGNMASTKEVASDTYVTGHHLLMLFFGFCPGENKDCLITLTQDNRSGSQIHGCDIICLSTCRFRLLSAWDIDCLLSQLAFVFQVDVKGLHRQKTNQCLMQELHCCFAGTGAVASCPCLPKIELLDFLTLSTQGDNLGLSGTKMLFALWPSIPQILHSLSDHISVPDISFKFTPLWSLSLEVMCSGFLAYLSLGRLLPRACSSCVLHIPGTSWLHQSA